MKIKIAALFFWFSFIISSRPSLGNETLKGVFVIGTWGRSGENGGIERGFIKNLKMRLAEIGVPKENIYAQSWHKNHNSSGLGYPPDTDHHYKVLDEKIKAHGLTSPTYLALIGHSFGGWATARLSVKIDKYMHFKPDAVYILDGVVHKRHFDHLDRELTVKTKYGESYRQTNSINERSACDLNPIREIDSCIHPYLDVSCGMKFKNLSNFILNERRKPDGKAKKKWCGSLLGHRVEPQAHVTIDDDEWLQHLIIERIVSDVKELKARSQRDERRYLPEFLGGYRHTNVQPRPESMHSHHPGVMSEDECWRRCLDNPNCNAMVHHTPTSGCYIKTGEIPPIPDWEHGTFRGVTIIPIRYKLEGVRHLNAQPRPDSMDSKHLGIRTEKECWQRCLDLPLCSAMVHDHKTFGCYLKMGIVPSISEWEHGNFSGATIIPHRYLPELLGGYRHTNVQPRLDYSIDAYHAGAMEENKCWRLCLDNPKCNAMVHHGPTSGCFLRTGSVPPISEWEHGTFTGVTIIPIRYNLKGDRHINVQPRPDSMDSLHLGIKTEKECWQHCLDTPTCSAMVHAHKTFGCYLKTGPVPPITEWEHGTFRGVTITPHR